MRGRGTVVQQIVDALKEIGPMTRTEICDAIEMDRMSVSAVITRMNRELPTKPKRVYILKYIETHEDAKRYPRAVYALGNREDAKKPPRDRKENRRRYIKKIVATRIQNSVFNLGITRKQLLSQGIFKLGATHG